MALLNTKPGSPAAMRQALQSVRDYFEFAEQRLAEIGNWPMPLPDTVLEVRHALGEDIAPDDKGNQLVMGHWHVLR